MAFSSFSLRFGRVGVALCSFMAFHAARLASCLADEREGMREFHARGGIVRRSSKSRQIQSLLGLLRPLRGSASPRATLAFARLAHGRALVHPLSTFRVNSGLPSGSGLPCALSWPFTRRVWLRVALTNERECESSTPVGASCEDRPSLGKFNRCPHGRALVHPLSTFRVNSGLPSGSGATRRLTTPKPSAALFRLSKLAVKVPRSVFRLRRASPPIH